MKINVHPMEPQWEESVKRYYGSAYSDLVSVFRVILSRAFMRSYWIPDPLALDYMGKILIRFLPVTSAKDAIEEGLALCDVDSDNPKDAIRFYESVGEMILWWSGLYKERRYSREGKRVFAIAYSRLMDFEPQTHKMIVAPGQEVDTTSKRLKVNKMFSEQYEGYQEILQKSDLIEDPAFLSFRAKYLDEGQSIN